MQQFCTDHGIVLKATQECGRGIYNTKDKLLAGTIVWSESPISYALKPNVCHYCWSKPTQTAQLYRCGNCKFARYCSEQCQAKDWKHFHKIRCKSISKLNGKIPTVTIVCIAELLVNIQPCPNIQSSALLRKLQIELMPTLLHHFEHKTEDEKSEMNQVSLCIALYMKSLQKTL